MDEEIKTEEQILAQFKFLCEHIKSPFEALVDQMIRLGRDQSWSTYLEKYRNDIDDGKSHFIAIQPLEDIIYKKRIGLSELKIKRLEIFVRMHSTGTDTGTGTRNPRLRGKTVVATTGPAAAGAGAGGVLLRH